MRNETASTTSRHRLLTESELSEFCISDALVEQIRLLTPAGRPDASVEPQESILCHAPPGPVPDDS
jgi:hypothetical protein